MEIRQWLERLLEVNDKVLLLPGADDAWNGRLVELFAARMQERGLVGTVITVQQVQKPCMVEYISTMQMQGILHLFQLYEFTDKLIVGSLEEPYGRRWKLLLENGCADREQLMQGMLNF